MIAFLKGRLVHSTPLLAVLEVNGVGYEVHVPVTTSERLPALGETVTLHTRVVYREDAHEVFGFASREERDFFCLLVEKVKGIGPRTAISLMSRLSIPVFQQAIAAQDVGLLSRVPGIGRKTAERLIVELKDKLSSPSTSSAPSPFGAADLSAPGHGASSALKDALDALVTLGIKPADADKALRRAAQTLGPAATSEALIRVALSGPG